MRIEKIKALTLHLYELVGGQKAAVMICSVRPADVSRWQSEGEQEMKYVIPVDHVMQLDAHCDDLFLKEWARERGYELVATDAKRSRVECVLKAVGNLSKQSGALEFTVLEVFDDNHFTPTEKRLIRDNIAPVKDALEQIERTIA